MTKKSKSKRTTSQSKRVPEKAARLAELNFQAAGRAAQQTVDDALNWWRSMPGTAGMSEQINLAATRALPLAGRTWHELLKLWRTTGEISSDLLRSALAAARHPLAGDSQGAWIEMWGSAIKTAQTNVDTLTQVAARGIGLWTQLLRQYTPLSSST